MLYASNVLTHPGNNKTGPDHESGGGGWSGV